LRIGDSGSVKAGDWVIAVGNPSGFENNYSSGIISASGNVIGGGPYVDFLQTDAAIDARNDGGPLLSLAGEVIGINSALLKENQGIGFAIPANIAKSSLQQLKEGGKVTRGWLGINIQAIPPELARSIGLKEGKGVLVQNVTRGGPAERANIKPGDVILEFDGKVLNETNELPRLVAATPVGKKLPVKILREGKRMEVTITIGHFPNGTK
jgi:serine protease Do